MKKEVEMKAFLLDNQFEEVKNFFQNNSKFLGMVEKKDSYFGEKQEPKKIFFRLREENGKNTITQKKRKILESGIEVNDEIEFEVSSAKNFLHLCESQNIPFLYAKEKNVAQFSKENMLIELVEIPGLGKFLEIEILCEEPEILESSEKISAIFSELGIVNQIEKKPYFLLFQERNMV